MTETPSVTPLPPVTKKEILGWCMYDVADSVIAKRIAQIHGATITFDDPAVGGGLEVTVSFARRAQDRSRVLA